MLHINFMSVGLNLIAFTALVSTYFNENTTENLMAIMVALLIWILDEIRYPGPVIYHDDSDPPIPKI